MIDIMNDSSCGKDSTLAQKVSAHLFCLIIVSMSWSFEKNFLKKNITFAVAFSEIFLQSLTLGHRGNSL